HLVPAGHLVWQPVRPPAGNHRGEQPAPIPRAGAWQVQPDSLGHAGQSADDARPGGAARLGPAASPGHRVLPVSGVMIFLLLLSMAAAGAESPVNGRRSVVLESKEARLTIDLAGGSIVDFHLGQQGLNPLQWEEPG